MLSSVPSGFSSASGSADGSGDGGGLASTVPELSSGDIGGSSGTVSSIDAAVSIGGLSAASSANAVSGKAVMSTSTASNTASDLLSFLIFLPSFSDKLLNPLFQGLYAYSSGFPCFLFPFFPAFVKRPNYWVL
ncbi:hypothetical protein [Hominenteromicrobium sp.]|uniref:hypothetical protein n=1 Tax=Hominenteromicrobium sp. TaxID=3073581 RepID=UPI003AEFC51F